MNFVVPDFYPAAAEIFVAVMALVTMLASAFARSIARSLAYYATQFTLIAAAFVTIYTMQGEPVYTFNNLFISDLMGDFLKLMIYFSTAIALLYGRAYLADRKLDRPEYYVLAQLMTLGMMVMVSANHMLPMYIGLEMMSLALYTMVAFDRNSPRSTEAAMKYFVLGALASGLLLYGMSMIYGATGSLEFSAIAQSVYNQTANQTVLMFGLVFLVAGICFKLGVVPFHMWVPDVYEGAPTAVTLMISTAPKLAAFAMAVRLLIWALFDVAEEWQGMLMMVAVASIALGNLAAIAQQAAEDDEHEQDGQANLAVMPTENPGAVGNRRGEKEHVHLADQGALFSIQPSQKAQLVEGVDAEQDVNDPPDGKGDAGRREQVGVFV